MGRLRERGNAHHIIVAASRRGFQSGSTEYRLSPVLDAPWEGLPLLDDRLKAVLRSNIR
jgi:hypothetical protein